ncbi:TetR/AcrR family transcriptional regulator [Mesobacillus campisalis]|uniref:TetR/AcrR family transcriptional regulator n=1 Tax=Mesobacillus campisalis TaxID=1408103 RepID=UPI00138F3DDE|nr:TetR/AcrR family transcriptional regulator [Mesobacillus campisalis]
MNTFQKLPREKQLKILDAAAEAFASKGYYGSGIKDICERANISNGALYKYFLNKEELFIAVLDRCQQIMVEYLYEKHTKIESSILNAIEEYLKEIAEICGKFPAYLTVYANLGSPNMEMFSERFSERFKESGKYIYEMVREAKKRGEVIEGIDERALGFLIDNQFILFLYSMLSDYHEKRFRSFMVIEDEVELTSEKKIAFIMDSIRVFLNNKKEESYPVT